MRCSGGLHVVYREQVVADGKMKSVDDHGMEVAVDH